MLFRVRRHGAGDSGCSATAPTARLPTRSTVACRRCRARAVGTLPRHHLAADVLILTVGSERRLGSRGPATRTRRPAASGRAGNGTATCIPADDRLTPAALPAPRSPRRSGAAKPSMSMACVRPTRGCSWMRTRSGALVRTPVAGRLTSMKPALDVGGGHDDGNRCRNVVKLVLARGTTWAETCMFAGTSACALPPVLADHEPTRQCQQRAAFDPFPEPGSPHRNDVKPVTSVAICPLVRPVRHR